MFDNHYVVKIWPEKYLWAIALLCASITVSPTPASAQEEATETYELIVRANKSRTPLRQIGSSVSVLEGIDIELQGFQFVSDALRTLPGVAVTRSGGSGQISTVFVRGEESYRTLVLIDGLEISDTAATQNLANLANVLTTDIDRIEVIRGPQGLLYGADAIGGVISIDTRKASDGLEATGAVQYGSFDTKSFSASLKGDWDVFNLNVSLQRFETDGFSAKEGDPSLADNDGSENSTIFVVAGFTPSDTLSIDGVFRYVDAETEFDGFSFDPDRLLLTEEIGGRAKIALSSLDDRLNNSIAFSRFDVKKDDLDGGMPTLSFFGSPISRFDGQRTKIEYVGTFDATESHRFLWGGDYEKEKAQTDAVSDETHNYGAYAEWLADWNDQIFVSGGVRFDDHADFGSRVSYRVSTAAVKYLVGDNETRFHASIGTGFRAPSLLEQARNTAFGLPSISEEISRGWDIGIEQNLLDERARIDVTYFNQRIEDEIRFDNVGFTGYFQSSGTSLSQGVEFFVSLEPLPGLTMTGTYTYTDSTVNSPDAENGLPRVRRPKHIGNVHIDYAFWNNRANINANLRTAAGAEDGFLNFRIPLDNYVVVDLAASVKLNDHFEMFGRVDNVFNEQYQEIAGFQTSDVAGYVGIRGKI